MLNKPRERDFKRQATEMQSARRTRRTRNKVNVVAISCAKRRGSRLIAVVKSDSENGFDRQVRAWCSRKSRVVSVDDIAGHEDEAPGGFRVGDAEVFVNLAASQPGIFQSHTMTSYCFSCAFRMAVSPSLAMSTSYRFAGSRLRGEIEDTFLVVDD